MAEAACALTVRYEGKPIPDAPPPVDRDFAPQLGFHCGPMTLKNNASGQSEMFPAIKLRWRAVWVLTSI